MDKMTYLDAKEARELAETSNAPRNRLYKAIKDMSKDGITTLWWNFDGMTDKRILEIIKELKSKGYTVDDSLLEEGNSIKVTW